MTATTEDAPCTCGHRNAQHHMGAGWCCAPVGPARACACDLYESARADAARSRPVTADQQAMWDALGILGFDLDGDPTPAARLVSGGQQFRENFLSRIREARADHDAALEEIP